MAGRPKKASTNKKTEVIEEVVEPVDTQKAETSNQDAIIAELMRQVQSLTEKLNAKEAEQTVSETKKQLPTKVKIISLVPNFYNLSTQENGAGKVFTFPKLGDSIIIRMSELEDVMSVSNYREQAEKGYFYICNSDVVEEFGLTDNYKTICDDKMLNKILQLNDDNAVSMFCGLADEIKESLATKIAEELAVGKRLDRNKIEDIRRETGIDIEKKASDIMAINKAREAKEED